MPDRQLLAGVTDVDLVIAVDSGVRIARSHGLPVHVLIGDLDSASEGDRAWALAEAAEIIEHPAEKDQTDLELALDHLVAAGATEIMALGVDGGRLDHELGNWSVLCRPTAASVEVRTATGTAHVLHGDGPNFIDITGTTDQVVTLLPVGGAARGVTTSGLKWELDNATLQPGTGRGVSNEFVDDAATITVADGSLLVVVPDPSLLG